MRKVGLVTASSGNAGTELQCYATQVILSQLGYQGVLLTRQESALSSLRTKLGRYAQYSFRCLRNPERLESLLAMRKYARASYDRVGVATQEAMSWFTSQYVRSESASFDELRRIGASPEYVAFLSGSDQIWSARGPYLDPMSFLRFVPREKRIAWAPSFGAREIPAYYRTELAQYISEYNYLSVREEAGAANIKDLTGREAPVLVDPTLQLDSIFWRQVSAEHSELTELPARYIFLYFLSPPSPVALETVKEISVRTSCELVTVFSDCDDWSEVGTCKSVTAGPFDFVSLIAHATLVCTDSFHGTTLSIDLNTPFLCFNRAYGAAFNDQSSRLSSILNTCGFEDRFLTEVPASGASLLEVDFAESNKRLVAERDKATEYLSTSIAGAEASAGDTACHSNVGTGAGRAMASGTQDKKADG